MDTEIPPTEATTAAAAATTSDQPVSPPAEARPAGASFTQEDVNRIVTARLNEDRARRSKETPVAPAAKPATTVPSSSSPPKIVTQEDLQMLLQRERVFTRAIATAGLTESQSARMERAMNADNPPDVAEWSRNYLEDMGLMKQATTTTPPAAVAATTPAAVATEAAKPPTAPSAPAKVDALTSAGLVDIWNLTDAQLAALGPSGVRAEFEKILKIGQQQAGAPPRQKAPQR